MAGGCAPLFATWCTHADVNAVVGSAFPRVRSGQKGATGCSSGSILGICRFRVLRCWSPW